MNKCLVCNSCTESRRIGDTKYYWCWLCNRFYTFINRVFTDVTDELRSKGLV